MQKICHGERFICTETRRLWRQTASEKTFFLFEMSFAAATKQQKFWPNEPGGRARLFFFLLFFLFIYFIYLFINSIQFRTYVP